MKKKDLISKWLDNDLTIEEREAFKQLDAFRSYERISNAARHFGAPDFDPQAGYANFDRPSQSQKSQGVTWYLMRIAAVFVVAFGVYYFLLRPQETVYFAENEQQLELSLPDTSEVVLNENSKITYQKKDWDEARDLTLEGEAFFKVAKGSRFTVQTDLGDVSVLGTQFNVNVRNGLFEVTCYEGRVQVDYKDESLELTPSQSFSLSNGTTTTNTTALVVPSWIGKKSIFKSATLDAVLSDLEQSYSITVRTTNVDKQVLFTGSFSHENLETALQAITIPLNLTFEIDGDIVTLKKK